MVTRRAASRTRIATDKLNIKSRLGQRLKSFLFLGISEILKSERFGKFSGLTVKLKKLLLVKIFGSKFGTTEFRTTNISEFQNYEY